MLPYSDFFKLATEKAPFPYQERLAHEPWPELLDVPTGLGKTAAIGLAWLYKLYSGFPDSTRRLVYCLPMRVLVEQTYRSLEQWLQALQPTFEGRPFPTVHQLMGGAVDKTWDTRPDQPTILVGTQDMLISRALNRGYAASRYRWPMQFAQLHNDALWVFDETQLMGVAVETSAQLEGLRQQLGTALPARTLWMSATLSESQLATVDHPHPTQRFTLGPADHALPTVQKRTDARKSLERAPFVVSKTSNREMVNLVISSHIPDTLTLVVVNRVQRAQELFEALLKNGRSRENTALIHSRFRPPDRRIHENLLFGQGDRIIVSTQAIEAGVDVSARTLISELAPWSSLVQRFGRCNRYGEFSDSKIVWVDLQDAPPYEAADLDLARDALKPLREAGPKALRDVSVKERTVVRPVLRRKDLLDLFDTTPDLSGNDLDIAPYVRDGEDTDVQIFWRELNGRPSSELPTPHRDELCSVSLNEVRSLKPLWRWDALQGEWTQAERPFAGQVYLADARSGGYRADLGWVPKSKTVVPVIALDTAPPEQMDAEPASLGDWVTLAVHLRDAEQAARELTSVLGLGSEEAEAVATAAGWHDVGKAHPAFQNGLGRQPGEEPCAKSPSARGRIWYRMDDGTPRPGFRHELASALAWLQSQPRHPKRDLIAYLIASHHGKVRLSLRSMPNENKPQSGLFARGVWEGDTLPALPGYLTEPMTLSLSLMQLGEGSWLSRVLALRDQLGPFRLAFLEALIRAADWSASKLEETRTPAHA